MSRYPSLRGCDKSAAKMRVPSRPLFRWRREGTTSPCRDFAERSAGGCNSSGAPHYRALISQVWLQRVTVPNFQFFQSAPSAVQAELTSCPYMVHHVRKSPCSHSVSRRIFVISPLPQLAATRVCRSHVNAATIDNAGSCSLGQCVRLPSSRYLLQ